MNASPIKNFAASITGFDDFPQTKQIDYITYYLTANDGQIYVNASMISEQFRLLNLKPYKRTGPYLSENASKKLGKYVKVSGGYRLTLKVFNELHAAISQEPARIQVLDHLRNVVKKVKDNNERAFLEEALACYSVEAYRGFMVMVWLVTVTHFQNYIFNNALTEFNSALGNNPEKRLKKIVRYDQFSEIQESKLIELSRSANIISNDMRKIMEEKLGTRNTAAHPSSVSISGHKATEFALDLIENIILKF